MNPGTDDVDPGRASARGQRLQDDVGALRGLGAASDYCWCPGLDVQSGPGGICASCGLKADLTEEETAALAQEMARRALEEDDSQEQRLRRYHGRKRPTI